MWVETKPTTTGYYWFYGDPFWDQLPHDEAKNINPFTPEMCIVEVRVTTFCFYICKNAFCYEMKGVWWSDPIIPPEIPNLNEHVYSIVLEKGN